MVVLYTFGTWVPGRYNIVIGLSSGVVVKRGSIYCIEFMCTQLYWQVFLNVKLYCTQANIITIG